MELTISVGAPIRRPVRSPMTGLSVRRRQCFARRPPRRVLRQSTSQCLAVSARDFFVLGFRSGKGGAGDFFTSLRLPSAVSPAATASPACGRVCSSRVDGSRVASTLTLFPMTKSYSTNCPRGIPVQQGDHNHDNILHRRVHHQADHHQGEPQGQGPFRRCARASARTTP